MATQAALFVFPAEIAVFPTPRQEPVQRVQAGRFSPGCFHGLAPVNRFAAFGSQLQSPAVFPVASKRKNHGHRAVLRAEYRRGGGGTDFLSGFIIGGIVFGTLGFIFSPQISKTLLGENADGTPRRLPRWMEDDDSSLEATRRKMNEKIAELNLAIDNTSAQLRADNERSEEFSEPAESAP